jgi:hypothetical protein
VSTMACSARWNAPRPAPPDRASCSRAARRSSFACARERARPRTSLFEANPASARRARRRVRPPSRATSLSGAPDEHSSHGTRFDVRLTHRTPAWATVRLEISSGIYGSPDGSVGR